MKRIFSVLALFLTVAIFLASCKKETSYIDVIMKVSYKTDITETISISSGEYTFENISNGAKTKLADPATTVRLEEGTYRVSFTGEGKYNEAGHEMVIGLQGMRESVVLIGSTVTVELELIVVNPNKEGDFVIGEIFLAGTLKPDNKQYNGDQYFVIHNNSNKVLYADKLIFIESKLKTVRKDSLSPDIMSEAMIPTIVMMIPGSGKDYPVAPGESFIIADNAMDHTEANANSFDLSNAKFEWHSDESTVDVDNPKVPNLEIVEFSAGKFWMANKQANSAYVIGRLPENVSKESFLSQYKHDYIWHFNGNVIPQSAYKFPNEWIIDGVNMSPKADYQWGVLDQTIDLGFAYQGETRTPADNAGKAVIRKKDEVKSTEGGRMVLLDNNNSTTDFMHIQKASLVK